MYRGASQVPTEAERSKGAGFAITEESESDALCMGNSVRNV